jgi:predicted ArsR family transcriptional regulator
MQNEIMGFLSRHNGGKTAEIAEALAVTDYQARYYLLLLEKEGMVQRSPLRRGMATYWFLKGEICSIRHKIKIQHFMSEYLT